MAIDRTRYRQLDFIGARILQARELNWLQEMDQGVAVSDNSTPVSGQLQAQFRQGALYNITVGITGLVVTLSATDGSKPMMIFVRDRWEIFPSNNDDCTDNNGTYAGNHTITLTSIETKIYLNWELKIRTGGLAGDDPSLTDSTTNEAVASAGELILHLSHLDTSGDPLGGSQLAKNTSPVPLLTFTNNTTTLTIVPTDNVLTQAKASNLNSGFVKTTTANPVVVSTDDSRMTDGRPASDGSVHDHSVRTPVAAGGTNSDGTPTYTLEPPSGAGSDIGGISAAKIVLINFTQTLEAGWNYLRNAFNTLLSRYNAHETATLGQVNTHPIPTAAQVGAAPLSHVGQPLGLVTSHPPVVNVDSGGFRVNRSGGGGAVDDPAVGVFVSGSPIAAINHDGDMFSAAANVYSASGLLSPATIMGALGHLSKIAGVLSQHVNQTSHNNPHGLTPGDIGAASTGYVDSAVASVLATAEAYADSVAALILRATTTRTGTNHTAQQTGGTGLIPWFQTTTTMKYHIFKFGLHFELAIGSGAVFDQDTVPLPEASGWSSANAHCIADPQWIQAHYDGDRTAVIAAYWNPATNVVSAREHSNGHTPNYLNCWANVFAIFYRFV